MGVAQLLASSATWAIIIVNIVNHWGYFIYLNWIPSYLHASRLNTHACLRGSPLSALLCPSLRRIE